MNKLEKIKNQIEERYKNGSILQKYRNLDFPNNPKEICRNNLVILHNYFDGVMSKDNYSVTLDTLVLTYTINYVNSVKGYINRKRKAIEKGVSSKYKDSILDIIAKYWHKDRNESAFDTVISIRNEFEHNSIDGIKLKITLKKDKTIKQLMLNDIDLLSLFDKSYSEIERLDNEIKNYIEKEIEKCNLWDCVMFKNAFSKRFNGTFKMIMNPEPTQEECLRYDKLIKDLMNE